MASADSFARGVAPARAALAGNPSDGYGGAVLAVALPDHRAHAIATRSQGLTVSRPSKLVAAAVARFARERHPAALATAVRWSTSIPRSVGLGGSSAIVIATLQALAGLYGVSLEPAELAAFALAVETDDLGIAAGLQDRVAQAYGGVTFMDFGERRAYEQLDPGLLPPLVIAWRADARGDSGPLHGDLRARYERGEADVLAAMQELGSLARAARAALLAGDRDELARCVDGSFEVRRRMIPLDRRHVAMIERARHHGASANYTGSGGAVVAVCRDEGHRRAVDEALIATGCEIARLA